MSWKRTIYFFLLREDRLLGESSERDTKKGISKKKVEVNMRRKVKGKII
jgi:hypothetical protein